MGNKDTCVPMRRPCLSPHTMACSNFHILLESNNVTTHRRGNRTARRNHDRSRRNLQPACRYYLTPDVPYISVSEWASCVPTARLDPRFDRGNNDRMERTMGAQGVRVETLLLRAEPRQVNFRLGCDPWPARAPPWYTKHRNRYTIIPRFTSTERAFSVRKNPQCKLHGTERFT